MSMQLALMHFHAPWGSHALSSARALLQFSMHQRPRCRPRPPAGTSPAGAPTPCLHLLCRACLLKRRFAEHSSRAMLGMATAQARRPHPKGNCSFAAVPTDYRTKESDREPPPIVPTAAGLHHGGTSGQEATPECLCHVNTHGSSRACRWLRGGSWGG